MRIILYLSLCAVFTLNAQQSETVNLKWKISDTLVYDTIMKESLLDMSEGLSEDESIFAGMKKMLNKMQNQLSDLNYQTKLYPDNNGNMDIAMAIKQNKNDTTTSLFSEMIKLSGDAILRGKVSPAGEVLSFYYQREQLNIISMLFELPQMTVKKNDEWTLNVHMISTDQNFKADSLYKKNIARLKDLKKVDGHKIAVIEYDLEEYVEGDFNKQIMNMFSDDIGNKKRFMKMSYQAIAEFDIDEGRWLTYYGIMDTETNFSLIGIEGTKRKVFKLTPANEF